MLVSVDALLCFFCLQKVPWLFLGGIQHWIADHKPLISLLDTKNPDNIPPIILRFCLRLAKLDYAIYHVPGKELYTVDTLSRAPMRMEDSSERSEWSTDSLLATTLMRLLRLCTWWPSWIFYNISFCKDLGTMMWWLYISKWLFSVSELLTAQYGDISWLNHMMMTAFLSFSTAARQDIERSIYGLWAN